MPPQVPGCAGNAIPGIAAQEQARQRIRSIYAADYVNDSYAAHRALANRLIGAAAETKRDSDAKFVLLAEARCRRRGRRRADSV